MKARDIFPTLKQTYQDWTEDKVPRLAAALSYYTIFSIAPLLLVVLAILGLVFGHEAATGRLNEEITRLVGPTSAGAIQQMLANARKPSSGIIATVIGTVTLLLGAGGVFGQLQDALNTIWGVQPKPSRGVWGMVKDRFLSFAMVLGLGFLLMVSLVLSAGISAMSHFVGNALPGVPWLWEAANTLISLGVFTFMFALIFRFLPDAKVGWGDVRTGALMTALLFVIGKFAIGLYLGRGSVASAYGAAGSLVVLLLWIYYSAQILFFGAEFTKVYAVKFGSRIVPAEDAVPVTQEAMAEQGAPRSAAAKTAAADTAPHRLYSHPAGPPAPDLQARKAVKDGQFDHEVRVGAMIGAALGALLGLLRRPARRGHPAPK